MVLPAFFDLYVRGLLPTQWKLIGNGRGDVAHEDFRAHVREVLDEFGASTDRRAVERVRRQRAVRRRRLPGRGRRPAAGPDRADPRRARQRRRDRPLPGHPTGRLRAHDRGDQRARSGRGRQDRLREAVRHVAGQLPQSSTCWCTRCSTRNRSSGSTTSSARRRPRTCTCCVSRTPCSPASGTASSSRRSRSTYRRRWTSPTGRPSTMPPARPSTCWSPTCSRSRPRWRWSPRSPSRRRTCRTPGRR